MSKKVYEVIFLILFFVVTVGSCSWMFFVNQARITVWNKSDKVISYLHVDDFDENRYTEEMIQPNTSAIISIHYTGDGLYRLHGMFSDGSVIKNFSQYLGGGESIQEIEVYSHETKLVKSEIIGVL